MASNQTTSLAFLSDNLSKNTSMEPLPSKKYRPTSDVLKTLKASAATSLVPKSALEPSRSPVSEVVAKETAHSKYRDCSHDPIEDLSDPTAFLNAASSAKDSPFPVKLHRILCNPDYQDIIAWLPHGRSWRVLKPKAFEEKVIPAYFRHCRYSSFMRQVNGWGFKRIYQGADLNSYYHELFLQGLPHLCLKMRRPSKDSGKESSKPAQAPDFYALSEKNPLPCHPSRIRASSDGDDNAQSKSCSPPSPDSGAKKNSADQSKEKRTLRPECENSNVPLALHAISSPALNSQILGNEDLIRRNALKMEAQQNKPQFSVATAPAHDTLAAVLRQHQLQNPLLQLQLHGQPSLHQLEAQTQQQLLNLPNMMRPVISENEAVNNERIQQNLPMPELQNLLFNNTRNGSIQQQLNINAGQIQLQQLLAGNGGLAVPPVISRQQKQEQDLLKLLQLKQMQQQNNFF